MVKEVMVTGNRIPKVNCESLIPEALDIMNKKKLGVLLVVDEDDTLKGIFTDGDLRRCVFKNKSVHDLRIDQVMTSNPKTVTENRLALEALEIMQRHEITILPIVDRSSRVIGVVHLHALLGKGKFRFNSAQSIYD